MIIQYFPSKELIFDNITVAFNEHREAIRSKLNREYEEDDQIIELGNDFDPLDTRRDIYQGGISQEFYFFLNYNGDNLLIEVEVHQCEKITVLGTSFDFKDELDDVALKLSEYSQVTILSEGEILFNDLKMVLSDKRKKGGDGNTIGYLYCSTDISHLL